MNRRRDRHTAKLPLDERIRLRVQEAAEEIGQLYIEVQDHDQIHGVLIQIEVGTKPALMSIGKANTTIREILQNMVAESPEDKCLAGWTACFTAEGKTIASSWQSGEHVEEFE
jgi:hypothetical protein